MGKKRSKTQGDLSVTPNLGSDLYWDKIVIMPGRGLYEGFMKNNKREGMGTFTEKSGTVYRGMWANDEPHGSGLKVRLTILLINHQFLILANIYKVKKFTNLL